MSMGRSRVERQQNLWIATAALPRSKGDPFYEKLNGLLDEAGFDEYVEGVCAGFYAPVLGRPGLAPGRYFRLLLVGCFEGCDSERQIAWRLADSLSLRRFLGLVLTDRCPDHSTLSKTRRRISSEAHGEVFGWVLKRLEEAGLLPGRTVGIDGTMLQANASMRRIVRRDSGEGYQEYLRRLARESGTRTPSREDARRLARRHLARVARARVAPDIPPEEWESAAREGIELLLLRNLVGREEGRLRVLPERRSFVDYHANSITHLPHPGDIPGHGSTRTVRYSPRRLADR